MQEVQHQQKHNGVGHGEDEGGCHRRGICGHGRDPTVEGHYCQQDGESYGQQEGSVTEKGQVVGVDGLEINQPGGYQ